MWQVVAEENMSCTECGHEITSGTECLSQMPGTMPDHFRRRKYENFCIECPDCRSKGNPACYIRRLDHWYTPTDGAKEAIDCAYCGELIPKGTWTTVQKFYAWPEPSWDVEYEGGSPNEGGMATGARAAGSGSAGAARRMHAGAWHNLSPKTQRMFQTRGLGRGLGSRTPTEAQQFYETRIPEAIRYQGEKAVLKFISGKEPSHKVSVANAPGMAKSSSNVVWENARMNRSRGKRNMTAAEVDAIKSANRGASVAATAKGAAKGGVIAAALEAPVVGLENFFHWRRGGKSLGQATKDSAKSTVGAGAVGAGVTVATAGVAKGAALVGISPTLGPAGTPLAIAGVGLMVVSSGHRLIKAARRDLPLDEYRLFFCKDADCKTRFAQDVTNAAISMDNRGAIWLAALALASLTVVAIAIGIRLV